MQVGGELGYPVGRCEKKEGKTRKHRNMMAYPHSSVSVLGAPFIFLTLYFDTHSFGLLLSSTRYGVYTKQPRDELFVYYEPCAFLHAE